MQRKLVVEFDDGRIVEVKSYSLNVACDLFRVNYLSKGHIIKISVIKEDIEYTKEYKAEGYNWKKLEQFRRLIKGVNKEL